MVGYPNSVDSRCNNVVLPEPGAPVTTIRLGKFIFIYVPRAAWQQPAVALRHGCSAEQDLTRFSMDFEPYSYAIALLKMLCASNARFDGHQVVAEAQSILR